MIDFEELEGVFGKLPDEPNPNDDKEHERIMRVVAGDTMRLLRFNGG